MSYDVRAALINLSLMITHECTGLAAYVAANTHRCLCLCVSALGGPHGGEWSQVKGHGSYFFFSNVLIASQVAVDQGGAL